MRKTIMVFTCFAVPLLLVQGAANSEESEQTRSVTITSVPDENRPELVDLGSQAENPAGVTLDIMPGQRLRIGAPMSIRVTTKRSGYLVLLDVDADGKLTQLFPNRGTLVKAAGAPERINSLSGGRALTLPQPDMPGVQMIAGAPAGIGMIVAVLSEEPVQLLDLPDVPAQLMGKREALKFVTDAARGLRVEPRAGSGRFTELKLSFAAKFYEVQ